MISQRCRKCKSHRIRRGYRRTPLILRMLGIHELLCDNCNLLFTGFAIPWTVSSRRNRKKGGRLAPHENKASR
ncbi:MAG: hypothetical protein JO360_14215 [Acidobacteria bacterium]|nr:hypothetical protein [Acidobacteriota bacterium]